MPSSKCLSSRNKLSIHDFELGKCLGEGAFGQVFPAVHKATKMLVAIKKVAKEKVKYMLEQFINEIKIQMFLEHPNVVKLYGFFDDALHFYIIMEYMEGGNLFALIKKHKKLSETEAS
jgi:aurora kinase, other